MWVVVAIFFLAVAGSKAIWGGHELANYLDSSAMFPDGWTDGMVAAIVSIEFLIALLLTWEPTRRAGWLLTAGVCSAFGIFHIFGALFGFANLCNCVAVQLTHNGRTNHIWMALLCTALVLTSARMLCRRSTPSRKEVLACVPSTAGS